MFILTDMIFCTQHLTTKPNHRAYFQNNMHKSGTSTRTHLRSGEGPFRFCFADKSSRKLRRSLIRISRRGCQTSETCLEKTLN